ncbi:MAG: RluA family pseudouridine synthase [Magnetovibrio sp.]|nr:RluA family pseudouridine synthase [Magnetovibrio sp.]
MTEGTTYTVPIAGDKAGGRIDKILAAAIPALSRSRIQALMEAGAVRTEAGPATDGAAKARAGEVYEVHVPAPAPARPESQDIPLEVVFEDAHLIVVDKPAGLVVHPAAGHGDGTLVNALLHHCRGSLSGIGGVTRPGIVHRLDKDTSGLIVAAKDDATHQGLARQFAAHDIERAYKAMVWGVPTPPAGAVEGNIGRSPRNRKKMAVVGRGGKTALTRYKVLRAFANLVSLVECRLETGRTHQIRVHLSSIGHPVVGDPLYGGGARRCPAGVPEAARTSLQTVNGQLLHAFKLGFTHPVTGAVHAFESVNLNKMNKLLDVLDKM